MWQPNPYFDPDPPAFHMWSKIITIFDVMVVTLTIYCVAFNSPKQMTKYYKLTLILNII